MELSQEGALILSSAAVFHPFPGHLMQGGGYSLSADPLQQTEPMPGGDSLLMENPQHTTVPSLHAGHTPHT